MLASIGLAAAVRGGNRMSIRLRDVTPPVAPLEHMLWTVRKDTRVARAVVRILPHGRESASTSDVLFFPGCIERVKSAFHPGSRGARSELDTIRGRRHPQLAPTTFGTMCSWHDHRLHGRVATRAAWIERRDLQPHWLGGTVPLSARAVVGNWPV